MYAYLSDFVVFVHFFFILYVVLGGLLNRWWRPNIWIHLPVFVYGVFVELFAWICPLTPLENWLKSQAGLQPYETSFVERYLEPLIYPTEFTMGLQLSLTAVVLLVNFVIYFPTIRAWYKNRKKVS